MYGLENAERFCVIFARACVSGNYSERFFPPLGWHRDTNYAHSTIYIYIYIYYLGISFLYLRGYPGGGVGLTLNPVPHVHGVFLVFVCVCVHRRRGDE